NPSGIHHWVVHTRDGITFYLGDTNSSCMDTSPDCTRIGDEWYESHHSDQWGNTVTYEYQTFRFQNDTVDLLPHKIMYTSNTTNQSAQLAATTQVELTWTAPSSCTASGSPFDLPVGASVEYRTGTRKVRGAMKLSTVTTKVASGSTWR